MTANVSPIEGRTNWSLLGRHSSMLKMQAFFSNKGLSIFGVRHVGRTSPTKKLFYTRCPQTAYSSDVWVFACVCVCVCVCVSNMQSHVFVLSSQGQIQVRLCQYPPATHTHTHTHTRKHPHIGRIRSLWAAGVE